MLACSARGGAHLLSLLRFAETVAIAVDGDDVCAVDEPVYESDDAGRVWKCRGPLGEGLVRREHDPAFLLMTDPLDNTTTYTNDPIGRPTVTLLADGRQISSSYDPADSVTQIVLPSTDTHGFSFSPVELLASYTPPSVGSGSWATVYAYDLDRKPTTVTRPDAGTITYSYDLFGHLATTTYPQGTLTTSYNRDTALLNSTTSASGETTAFTYDGVVLTKATWSGVVPGTLSFVYDNNLRITSQTVNGTAQSFGYDPDGLLTSAGTLAMTRDAQNGRLNGTTLGSIIDSYGYDSNGLFASYTATYNGSALYTESVLRDAAERITQKSETVQGTTHVWGYTFDATGRLTDVTKDANFFSHYGYDADDNRTTYQNANGTVNPTYDAQDRLLRRRPRIMEWKAYGNTMERLGV